MIPHDRIPLWENRKRRRALAETRDGLTAYFDSVSYEAFPFQIVESEDAVRIRSAVRTGLADTRAIIEATARVPLTRLTHGERPGEVQRVDLLDVVFDLDRYSLDRGEVFAALDLAEEVYRDDTWGAGLRTLNPLYWIDMTLSLVETLPFLLLNRLGVRSKGFAHSTAGVWLRFTLRLVTLLLIIFAILLVLGLEQDVLALFRSV